MAKFTIKTLMEMLGKDTSISSHWLREERSWLMSYAKNNPVRSVRLGRQKRWISLKKSPMFISLILAASLLLGGGGVVAAAQNDLPNEPLYNIKIAGEKVRAAVAGDAKARAELRTKFAKKRLEEINLVNKKSKLKAEIRERAIAKAEANYRANLEAAESDVVNVEASDEASASGETSVASKLEKELADQEKTLVRLEVEVPKKSKKAVRQALVRARGTRETAAALKAGLKLEADARTQIQANSSSTKTVSASEEAEMGARAKAQGRIGAAENKLRASTKIVKRVVNDSEDVEANTKLKLASEALLRAKTSLESKDYRQAWLLASTSIKLSIEAAAAALSREPGGSDNGERENDQKGVSASSSASVELNVGGLLKLR